MTLPIWPSTLQKPLKDGFTLGRSESRILTRPESGPMRARRRSTTVTRSVSLTIVMSHDDLAVFESFYENDTAEGSLLFWMPDPMKDGLALEDDTGEPLEDDTGEPLLIADAWLAMFSEQLPATVPHPAILLPWKTSFGLVVYP